MKEPNWTWKEIDFLRTNYSKMTNAELARKLGRTYGAVIMRAYKMGLKKKNGNKLIEWTPQKLKLLTDFFPTMFNDALAKWLGVSRRTLTRKARELGLKKRDDFYQLKRDVWVERQREGLRKVECSTRIKKGQHLSPATEFKKGSRISQESIAKRKETRMRTMKRKEAALLERKLKAQIKSAYQISLTCTK